MSQDGLDFCDLDSDQTDKITVSVCIDNGQEMYSSWMVNLRYIGAPLGQ